MEAHAIRCSGEMSEVSLPACNVIEISYPKFEVSTLNIPRY